MQRAFNSSGREFQHRLSSLTSLLDSHSPHPSKAQEQEDNRFYYKLADAYDDSEVIQHLQSQMEVEELE